MSSTCAVWSSLHNQLNDLTKMGTSLPFGATTKPRPFDAPLYTVSIISIICSSVLPHLNSTTVDLKAITDFLLLGHCPITEPLAWFPLYTVTSRIEGMISGLTFCCCYPFPDRS